METKTTEQLAAMSREELEQYAYRLQGKAYLYELEARRNERLCEILAAVGIAYETYKTEFKSN